MATLTVGVHTENGKALNGIMLKNGRYDTSPCPWNSTNCTSGSGNGIGGTTDGNGQVAWSIPYTCVGLWSGNWQADGYIDYAWSDKTGYISGDVDWTVAPHDIAMVQTDQAAIAEQQDAAKIAIEKAKANGETQAQAQADAIAAVAAVQQNKGANWLAGDIANQVSASYTATGNSGASGASDTAGAAVNYWWLILLFVIVGAVAVFIILRGAKGGGGGKMTMPAAPKASGRIKGLGSSIKAKVSG